MKKHYFCLNQTNNRVIYWWSLSQRGSGKRANRPPANTGLCGEISPQNHLQIVQNSIYSILTFDLTSDQFLHKWKPFFAQQWNLCFHVSSRVKRNVFHGWNIFFFKKTNCRGKLSFFQGETFFFMCWAEWKHFIFLWVKLFTLCVKVSEKKRCFHVLSQMKKHFLQMSNQVKTFFHGYNFSFHVVRSEKSIFSRVEPRKEKFNVSRRVRTFFS